MPEKDLIDVRISVNGDALTEYRDPEHRFEDNDECITRYVEARTGAAFEIDVIFRTGFALKRASFLYSRLCFDSNEKAFYHMNDTAQLQHSHGILTHDVNHTFSTLRIRDPQSGQWERSRLTFGQLRTIEGQNPQLAPSAVEKLGVIRVQCFRARESKLSQEEPVIGDFSPINEIPETALKHQMMKHAVTLSGGEPCDTPGPRTHKYDPVSGDDGKIYEFRFIYRDRGLLQALGVIAPSPEPERKPNLNLNHTADLSHERRLRMKAEDEILRLRKLLGTHQDKKTKQEIDHDVTNRGIKRGRVDVDGDDNDDDDDDVVETAPPPKRPVETIDLTDY